MKAIQLLPLLGIALFLSCKKKDVQPNSPIPVTPSDYSHMTGNFLCELDETIAYQAGETSHSDKVITVSVSNDTLYADYHFFVISADTQTVFTKTENSSGTIKTSTLSFSNNYNNIHIDIYQDGSPVSGPVIERSYAGTRSLLPVSSSIHVDDAILNGFYQMIVHKLDTEAGNDTTYVDTLSVNFSNATFHFNADQVVTPNFRHTFLEKNNWNYFTDETEDLVVFWDRTDSLHVYHRTISNAFSGLTPDTVIVRYSGRHL